MSAQPCRLARLLLALLAFLLMRPAPAAEPVKDKDGKPKYTNKLARESSPYLLQHAHNPVDWYPWGPDAFAKARKENKLIFLSIGYSSCYWCHVMERQSFANPEVARLLNDWFVCIKVDREERPDVDNIYMTALYVLGGRGGWPLSMFLTPDGKPIVGGTYWPPEDREVDGETLLGFKSVLKRVHDLWVNKPKDLLAQGDTVAERTADALSRARGLVLVALDRDLVKGAVEAVREEFDPVHGGFGNKERMFRGTKFPTPPYLFLLHDAATGGGSDGPEGSAKAPPRPVNEEAARMLALTLDRMAYGGIYDHLGGGFHRYSTERTWTVPHFEKMLYDNAQLAEMYARAYRATKKPLYRRVVEQTLAFVGREMTSPEGAFYSALDAETDEEEGRFYVWTAKEIDEALGNAADAALFRKVYGADGPANFENKYHILVLPRPEADVARDLGLTEEQLRARLEPLRKKLFDARSKRPRPFLDTKVLTAWNGQMIAGYAVAGQMLEEKAYLDAATRAADFILNNLRSRDGRLLRSWSARPGEAPAARLNAYLDDYAFFVHGLLCLHDASGDRKWLDHARALTDLMIEHYQDKGPGGFFYTSADHEKLFVRAKDQYDGAQPSGNSMAARNLVRLWRKTGDDRYRLQADRAFKAFGLTLKNNPTALTTLAEALSLYLDAGAAPANQEPAAKQPAAQPPRNRSDSVVQVNASAAKPGADGKQVVTLTLTIDKDWHLYANPVGSKSVAGNETVVTVVGLQPGEVTVMYPKGKAQKEPNSGDTYFVYEGQVTIPVLVPAGKGPGLEIRVRLTACSDARKICLMPATVTVKVP